MTAASASAWPVPSSPSGARAPTRATPATQAISASVGRWTRDATRSPPSPAAIPAGSPQVVTRPATGTARRLAGSDTTGRPPKRGSRIGATPTWAAMVTAMASRHHRGPRRRAAIGADSTAIPSEAPAESWNATEWMSNGSTSTSAVTAKASVRSVAAGRPAKVAVAAMAAMTEARSTDGSNRVSTPKAAISPRVAAQRHPRGSRSSAGPARTRMKATF